MLLVVATASMSMTNNIPREMKNAEVHADTFEAPRITYN